MRIPSYALLTFLATGAAGVIAACSGDVATTTNATSTSSGTTTSTTAGTGGVGGVAMTSSVTTSTVATTTGGTGGQAGDPKCLETCAKGDSCGFGICDQFGVDCTNPPAQLTPCLEDCIISASCDDLAKAANMDFNTPFGACALGCMGMGTTTGAGGGGGGGGGPPQTCQKCAQNSCGASIQGCLTDFGSGCPQWLQCIQGCNNNPTPQCAIDCDNAHMGAKAKYDPVYACICMSCNDSCGAIDPCGHVPDGG